MHTGHHPILVITLLRLDTGHHPIKFGCSRTYKSGDKTHTYWTCNLEVVMSSSPARQRQWIPIYHSTKSGCNRSCRSEYKAIVFVTWINQSINQVTIFPNTQLFKLLQANCLSKVTTTDFKLTKSSTLFA